METDERLHQELQRVVPGSRVILPFVNITRINFVDDSSGITHGHSFTCTPADFPNQFPKSWRYLHELGARKIDLRKRKTPRGF